MQTLMINMADNEYKNYLEDIVAEVDNNEKPVGDW